MAGPGYTVKDAFEYGGFIVGTCIAVTVARQMGYTGRWESLLIGLAGGFACGFVGHWLHRSLQPGPDRLEPPS